MNKTISDIAQMAGVAKSTVSRFLNGGSVSEDTRQKIERIIKEYNYVPNTLHRVSKPKDQHYRYSSSASGFLCDITDTNRY